MKTIKTTLLIFALLGAIMPAMAQVNFTEKTYFVASNDYHNNTFSEIVTSMYLNNTVNGITLSSSGNNLEIGSQETELSGRWNRWVDNSCDDASTSIDDKYFQITSAEKDIKYISVRNNTIKKSIVIVGWRGEVSATADYYIESSILKVSDYRWTSFDLSQWEGVRTIRLYSGIKEEVGLKVDNEIKDEKSVGSLHIYGIQVGLSSNTTSISPYGFAAFSSTSALDFTNVTDCNAYYADSYANGTLHLTKAEGVVPANFGLLLCAPKGVTTPVCIPVATAKCTLTASDNVFEATSTGTYSPASTTDALALGVKNGQAGFYYVGAGVTIPLNKMYLPAPKVAEAKSVVLDFGGIDPTGIVNVSSDDAANTPSAQRPATDLLGRPCPNPMPGQIYIKDGKVFKLTN